GGFAGLCAPADVLAGFAGLCPPGIRPCAPADYPGWAAAEQAGQRPGSGAAAADPQAGGSGGVAGLAGWAYSEAGSRQPPGAGKRIFMGKAEKTGNFRKSFGFTGIAWRNSALLGII